MKICKYKRRFQTAHVAAVVFEVKLVLITAIFGMAINYNTVWKSPLAHRCSVLNVGLSLLPKSQTIGKHFWKQMQVHHLTQREITWSAMVSSTFTVPRAT